MNILQTKLSEDRQNSFWYHNEDVAEVETPTGKISLFATGEIEVYLPIGHKSETEKLYKGENAVVQALNLAYVDEDIEDLMSNDLFRLNNWFAISHENDVHVEVICTEYDEAIDELNIFTENHLTID